ncbi:hypothetical protein [Flavobacterium phragmitis]|uniref:Uncharacterized protein n=1 Tax=Flavobacterium phragmitis TaxID=739143 RepID=A0A1I1VMV9_9FLAO|nr:hypothetical protein [Flavobacterium phragmitis]SFD84367.1 hypothetical protein SAMN05216297_11312 [Flavobacterium phragmitis]
MFDFNPFLLLFLPLILQLIFGIKDYVRSIKLNFAKISIINFLLQIAFSYWAYAFLEHKLNQESNGRIRCGMPFVGLVFTELLIIAILLVTILVQYLIKRSYNRKQK